MNLLSASLLLVAAVQQAVATQRMPSSHAFRMSRRGFNTVPRGGSSTPPPPEVTNVEAVDALVAEPETISQEATADETTAEESSEVEIVHDYKLGPNAPPPGFLRQTFPSFPWHSLPNAFSVLRCLLIPALIGTFYRPGSNISSAIVFALASITDWIDGYLARLWDITSPLGALLDTIADKLMVSSALILLAGRYGVVVAVPTAIIVSREIAITALREWMAQQQLRDAINVKLGGKIKTAVTMISLTVLLLVPSTRDDGVLSRLYEPGLAFLYLCAVLTLTSGSEYFLAAAKAMSKPK